MFEFESVADSAMLGLWWKKSLGSTLSRNTWQAHPVGMTAYQAKLQTQQPLGPA
jgi:hypothetical protein